jgi:hypothetical protein
MTLDVFLEHFFVWYPDSFFQIWYIEKKVVKLQGKEIYEKDRDG